VRLMRTLISAALAASCLAPPAVRANPVEEKNVLSGKEKLDPAKGYILVSGPARQLGMFLRVPDDATRNDWQNDRLKAFEKAKRRYASNYTSWQVLVAAAKHSETAAPPAPVEPTLETTQVEPLELRDMVSFGPQFVYAKGETITYMQSVKPGTYIWYGNVMGGAGLPAAGTCLCMGTVRFEVKPGVVTDLGNWLQAAPHWTEDLDVVRLQAKEAAEKRAAEGKEPRTAMVNDTVRFGLPASLKDWPSVQAEFHAHPKVNNLLGVFISRIGPVPGVIGYHRDAIVDLRSGQELASPTMLSRAKIKK
jgi:hypothetical protein